MSTLPAPLADPPAPSAQASALHPPPGTPGRLAHIRSFVLRRGHLSDAQRTAHSTLAPHYALPYQNQALVADQVFGRNAPLILEIGFGMGQTTAEIAALRPNDVFLGVEVYTPGVGSLLRQLHERQLNNVRIIQHDAVEVVRDMIPAASLAGVHIYFPDPWPKKRHHKRRLIQAPFVALLSEKLAPDGYLHCATDWQDYAEHMLAVLSAEPRLRNTAPDFAPRPSWRPETKFERRGLRLGHGVWDLMFRRCRPSHEDAS